MPTKAPSEPMIASQPCRTAASTATLTWRVPMTLRRSAAGARGTARSTAPRRRARRRRARAGACAPRPRSRPPSRWRTARRRRPLSAGRDLVGAGGAAVRLVVARAAAAAGSGASAPARSGASRCSSASCQHSTVSTASHGRNTSRFGIARSAARCSTGWWVGPSSPSPIESCVITWMTRSPISAARRIAGRQ